MIIYNKLQWRSRFDKIYTTTESHNENTRRRVSYDQEKASCDSCGSCHDSLLINVSESYFTRIAKNSTVSVKFDVYGEEEFEGKVNLLYPTIDPSTRTFVVEIRLDNRDMRVRLGMFARVTFNFGTADHVIIPDKAIIKQAGSGERYVYVYQDGVVYQRVVQLGQRINDEYEIVSSDRDRKSVV